MNKPRLQILRGLPGSGKSTLAIEKYPSLMRVETDMFFTRGGEYIYTPARNLKAVIWFEDMVFNCCYAKMDFVATGVFTAHTERLERCIRTALDFGYEVYIKTLPPKFQNTHNVAAEDFKAMNDAFVSERELKRQYKRFRHVHFGLMPNKITIGGKR